jgi:hypothetical protein
MNEAILDLTQSVVFLPVRHHSPTCSRAVRQAADRIRPAAILIEGPSDFNGQWDELHLEHQLPIAIYSYFRTANGERRGAYYPFCVYSPEWQAIRWAREVGVPARFIDLPWSQHPSACENNGSHLYADGELRYSDYMAALCDRFGVADFDALWDTLFEIEPDLQLETFLERCHRFCYQARILDSRTPTEDLLREAYMADQIRNAQAEVGGPLLVVTGGFHSHALFERLIGVEPELPEDETLTFPAVAGTGIALTPYSYERLDSLTGYDAGMPSPGFYHQAWVDAEKKRSDTHTQLLTRVTRDLRKQKQRVSTADLIAVETTARGVAALRGHGRIWRADLIDGILGALVKDELEQGVRHPFLDAVHEVFRGGERGKLAEGVSLPPLVHDVRRCLDELGLKPEMRERSLELDLAAGGDLARSRALHRLVGLGIAGFQRTGGSDFAAQQGLAHPTETWRVRWSPEYEGSCIEAAIYGPTLEEAAGARLLELARKVERSAAEAARLRLAAAMMGLEHPAAELHERLVTLVRQDGDFARVAGAVGHLLYLYRYDETLGSAGGSEVGTLLEEAWTRGLWLLESLGDPSGQERAVLKGIATLVETLERCPERNLGREELSAVLHRIANASHALLRGAASGALWSLREADSEALMAGMRYCSGPERLGDYLTGLFSLARETAQRDPSLVLGIDDVIKTYADEQFLEALPALRLAFSFFTPREKHHLARTLLESLGLLEAAPLPALQVSAEQAAVALAFEARVFETAARYGIRLEERAAAGVEA